MIDELNRLRPRMMSVAYRMLGSVADAEDAVQDAFLRYQTAGGVVSTEGFLIKASKVPYTIVRATQFFEFVGGISQSASDGQTVRLPPALMQPIASDDVAAALADVAVADPLNRTVDLAGPETIRMDDLVRQFLVASGDTREVITDPQSRYFGVGVNDQSLTPGDNPRIGSTRFVDWLSSSRTQR